MTHSPMYYLKVFFRTDQYRSFKKPSNFTILKSDDRGREGVVGKFVQTKSSDQLELVFQFSPFYQIVCVSLGISLYSEINRQTVPLGITVTYDLFFETIWHFGTHSNLRIFVFFGNSHGGQGER